MTMINVTLTEITYTRCILSAIRHHR
jgi:hypothetical protein